MQNKKVVIIGAGISGLTAGIYALDNGFDVEIYEKNPVAGGLCTGWKRDGIFIDGCAHWIVGTNPRSDLYPVWYHIGGVNENIKVYDNEYFCKYHFDNNTFTLYSDLDKFYEELYQISPADNKIIKKIIKHIENYQYTRVPLSKPIEMMNIFELIKFGIKLLPLLTSYVSSRHESLEELGNKFKNKGLKELFTYVLDNPKYNCHAFYYTMGTLSKNDAGTLEGGSFDLSNRVKEKFISLGGKLFLNSPVKRIVIEGNKASGIELENGKFIESDYIIAATDIYHTFSKLIGNAYMSEDYKAMQNKDAYRLNSTFFLAYKFDKENIKYDGTEVFKIDDIKIGNSVRNQLRIRFSKDYFSVMIHADYEESEYIYSLSKEEYKTFKNNLAKEVKEKLIKVSDLKDEDFHIIDVATPKTYERYTNANQGSFMTYVSTKHSHGLLNSNHNMKIKNLVFASQWVMAPGGLPIAIMSGKHAAVRLCKLNKQKFVNKEEKKAEFYTCKHKIKFH